MGQQGMAAAYKAQRGPTATIICHELPKKHLQVMPDT